MSFYQYFESALLRPYSRQSGLSVTLRASEDESQRPYDFIGFLSMIAKNPKNLYGFRTSRPENPMNI